MTKKSTKSKQGKKLKSGLPPSPNRYVTPDCPSCRSESTITYKTLQLMRYCKCRRCGFTWSESRKIVIEN